MKNRVRQYYFLLSVAVFVSVSASGQGGISWGYVNQKIELSGSRGKMLLLEAMIKNQFPDSANQAGLYIWFIDKNDKYIGQIIDTVQANTGSNWTPHFLSVSIPSKAAYAQVGGRHRNKGVYYYDDFSLRVINQSGDSSKNLLQNAGFEEDSLHKHWASSEPNRWFQLEPTTGEASSGNRSLRVDGRVFRRLIIYGKNDSVGRYVDANNVKLYCETYGSGEPLILLHGNGQYSGVFSQQIFEFSKYYQVIALDTRGHGRSSEDGRKYSYDLFAEDLNAFMDSLHLSKARVIGWSDGANTALILAMKHPEKISSLAAMGANIFIDKTVVEKRTFNMLHKGIRYFSKDSSYASQNKVRLLQLLLTEPNYQFSDLGKIPCPVLVMAGQKDIIQENHTRGIAAAIPGGSLYIVPNATHFLPQENARLFNKIVLSYFRTGKVDVQ